MRVQNRVRGAVAAADYLFRAAMPRAGKALSSLALAAAVNICSSVGISVMNKRASNVYGFRFVPTLVLLNFVMTAVYAALASSREPRHFRRMDCQQRTQLAVVASTNSAAVVLMNSSLVANSMSFYQLCKQLSIPCTMALQYSLFGVRFGRRICGTLAVLLAGILLATATDAQANFDGSLYALTAVPVVSLGQIVSSRAQKRRRSSQLQWIACIFGLSAARAGAGRPHIYGCAVR